VKEKFGMSMMSLGEQKEVARVITNERAGYREMESAWNQLLGLGEGLEFMVLQWVAHSARPLKIKREAMALLERRKPQAVAV